jgi:hypothetical protein
MCRRSPVALFATPESAFIIDVLRLSNAQPHLKCATCSWTFDADGGESAWAKASWDWS